MSNHQAFEAQSKQVDKAQESGHHSAMSHIAAAAYHPEAAQAKQTKTEPNAIDFGKAGDIYASKAMIQSSTGDPRLQGGANTATDTSPANTMSAEKPADKPNPELTKIKPLDMPKKLAEPFLHPSEQGTTKPGIADKLDMSNSAAADGKPVGKNPYDKRRENSDGAAKPSSDDSEPVVPPVPESPSDDKPAAKPADKPSSSVLSDFHKLQDLWGSEITTLLGYAG